MLNHQATPAPLGLSVGGTNLAAVHGGRPVLRPSEVTVEGQRFTGFVDRVGDPVPMVAPDGSTLAPEALLAQALGALARETTDGVPAPDVTITVPAHWRPSVVDTLRRNMREGLSVVSDATAALAALRANPGLPARGVIVLCDFGGSGTSITLANASAHDEVVGETVRYTDFSGDHLDQALLTHVVSGLDMATSDPFGTAMVGTLATLRGECRRAKERLSAETATAVTATVGGHHTDVRVTRGELEALIKEPFAGFLAALDETLERYSVPAVGIAAVATIGGGARIPLVTQLLSEHLRAPVVTTLHPQITAAEGATLIAARSFETATALSPAAVVGPTTMLDAPSATMPAALAWSQDEPAEDELPFVEDTGYHQGSARPELQFQHEEWQEEEAPPRRAPLMLFVLSAAAVALTATAFGLMQLTTNSTPVEAATSSVAPSSAPAAPVLSPAPPAPQAPQATTVVVQPAQRASSGPRPQAPARPAAPPPPVTPTTTVPPATTPPPTTTPPTTPPTSPPTSPPSSPPSEPPAEPPSEPPADPPSDPPADPPSEPQSPQPPPADPGQGDADAPVTDPPPADPAEGGSV
jgi:hypothetical protein